VTVRPLPLLLVLLVLLAAAPLVAGYASRDLVIPVAGHAVRGDGRVFETTLWITNVSTRDAANVTVTFYAAGRTHTPPHESTLQLAPRETRITPVADSILGAPNGIGWLHVEATSDVCVDVEIASRLATDPPSRALSTTLAAIPRRFAIGSGQSVLLHGVSLHPAYLSRFYVAETNGQDLHFALILLDAAGREVARKLSFVSAHEQLSGELASEFPNITADVAAVRIEPVNGGGRFTGHDGVRNESSDGSAESRPDRGARGVRRHRARRRRHRVRGAPEVMSGLAKFAEIALPVAVQDTYTYAIPDDLHDAVRLGSRVEVPLGTKLTTGFVVALTDVAPAGAKMRANRGGLDV
jgi:hypothetical protein